MTNPFDQITFSQTARKVTTASYGNVHKIKKCSTNHKTVHQHQALHTNCETFSGVIHPILKQTLEKHFFN